MYSDLHPKMLLSPAGLRTAVLNPYYMSWTSLIIYFSGTFRSLEHLHISSMGVRSYAFSRSKNVTLMFFRHALCFSIVCIRMKIAYVVLLPGISPNWLGALFILLSTTLSHIFKVRDRSLIQRWFLHCWMSPFPLKIGFNILCRKPMVFVRYTWCSWTSASPSS